ncbi:MAG: hypothetical protein M1426_00125 [Patescibacteria group bacterium]|nr:hypothetical protein [Patescibacteria group bacterium]
MERLTLGDAIAEVCGDIWDEQLAQRGIIFMGKDKRYVPDPTVDGKQHDNPNHPSKHANDIREQQTPKPKK